MTIELGKEEIFKQELTLKITVDEACALIAMCIHAQVALFGDTEKLPIVNSLMDKLPKALATIKPRKGKKS